MKTICFVIIANFLFASSIFAQTKMPVDTVYLFATRKKLLKETSDFRMIGKKLIEVTNFAGNRVILRISNDKFKQIPIDVVLRSPEKKVLYCPKNVDSIFVTINPQINNPARKILKREIKYELYYNVSKKLYDIKLKD